MAEDTNQDRDELQELADDIRTQAGDETAPGFVQEMMKGVVAGFGELLELTKGDKKDKKGDDDDDDDPTGNGDADEGGQDAADDNDESPGYTDMHMAVDIGEGDFDATEVIMDIGANLKKLAKGQDQLRRENRALLKKVEGLEAANVTLAKGIVLAIGPMAKGIAGIRTDMANIPEATVGTGFGGVSVRARNRHQSAPKVPEGTPTLTKLQLTKATMDGRINTMQVQAYKQFGRFDQDDTENRKLIDDILASA